MSKDLLQLTEEELKTKSQATYFFDCTNKGTIDPKTNKITNLSEIVSKGSFCCILQRLKYQEIEVTDNGKKVKKLKEIDNPVFIIDFNQTKSKETLPGYYILTAGHNLGNGTVEKTPTNVGSQYKLIKDASNYVKLELMEYSDPGVGNPNPDYAILKVLEPDFQTHDCYTKRIPFSNYSKSTKVNEKRIFPEDEKLGYIVGLNYKSGNSKNREYDEIKELYQDDVETTTPTPTDGTSGAAVFGSTNLNILGVYKGIVDGDKYCSVCEDIHSIKNEIYIII